MSTRHTCRCKCDVDDFATMVSCSCLESKATWLKATESPGRSALASKRNGRATMTVRMSGCAGSDTQRCTSTIIHVSLALGGTTMWPSITGAGSVSHLQR